MDRKLIKDLVPQEEIIIRLTDPNISTDFVSRDVQEPQYGNVYQYHETDKKIASPLPLTGDNTSVSYGPIGVGSLFSRLLPPFSMFIQQEDTLKLGGLDKFSLSVWVNFSAGLNFFTNPLDPYTFRRGASKVSISTYPANFTIIDCPSFQLYYQATGLMAGNLVLALYLHNGQTLTEVSTPASRLHNLDGGTPVTWESPDYGWVRLGVSVDLGVGQVKFLSNKAIFLGASEVTQSVTGNTGLTRVTGSTTTVFSSRALSTAPRFFKGLLNDLVVFSSTWDELPTQIREALNAGEEYVGYQNDTNLSDAELLHLTFMEESPDDTIRNSAGGIFTGYARMIDAGLRLPTAADLSYPVEKWLHFPQTQDFTMGLRLNDFPDLDGRFSISLHIRGEQVVVDNRVIALPTDPPSNWTYTAGNASTFFSQPRTLFTKKEYDAARPDFDLGLVNMNLTGRTARVRLRVFGRTKDQYVQFLSDPIQFFNETVPLPMHIAVNFDLEHYGQDPNSNFQLFVNGSPFPTISKIFGGFREMVEKHSTLWIGIQPERNFPFRGLMADVRMMTRTLTQPEVTAIYAAGTVTHQIAEFEPAERIFHYRMDDTGQSNFRVLDWASI